MKACLTLVEIHWWQTLERGRKAPGADFVDVDVEVVVVFEVPGAVFVAVHYDIYMM